jgi:enoyl-CoA hydratase/carnithine racemase
MNSTSQGTVRLEVDGSVGLVTLDRPAKLNALTSAMTDELAAHVDRINRDRAIRVAVLTGSGAAFCAGSDIAELDNYDGPWDFGRRRDYGDLLRTLDKPVIAAVNGYAFGGGLELALACDIRIAADAARFAAPEIKLGWVGGSGQCASLAHSVGPGNAAWMIYTGEAIDAATALSWGLVTRTVPPTDLLTHCAELASTIAERAPIAAQTAKINLRAAYDLPMGAAIGLERHLQTICFGTADAAEGRAAFAERRAADFHGR